MFAAIKLCNIVFGSIDLSILLFLELIFLSNENILLLLEFFVLFDEDILILLEFFVLFNEVFICLS